MAGPMNVLLTGGTGFLGEYLLAELLERGHSVWAMYRTESRKLDTIRFLGSQGLPRSAESLHWFKGEVSDADEEWPRWRRQYPGLEDVDTLVHSAASTRLHMDESGEPLKTNLGSARALKRLMQRKPMKAHLISTAYVCGLVQGKLVKEVNHPPGDWLNVYEESKWEAEQLWMGQATLLRPSIIVGHSETARCTSFTGWYILFQAADMADRLMNDMPEDMRLDLRINLPADPNGTTNIIPVDYAAKAAIRIIEKPENHNKIYHLTNPNPPTHEWTYELVKRRFKVGGLNFAGAGTPFTQPRNNVERMIWRQMQTILLYFSNNPIFDRSNTDLSTPELQVPPVTESYIHKLIDYAVEHDWGQ